MNNETNRSLFEKNRFKKIIAVVIGALVVIFGVLVAFSSQSLPGEALYGVKTQVLERLVASVQFGSNNEARNIIRNMETRLAETKELAQKDTVEQSALDALYARMLTHSEQITAVVMQERSDFTMEDRLFVLDDFASVAGAIEIVAENDAKLAAFAEQAEDLRRDAVNLYKDTADAFVQGGILDTVLEYIKNSLSDVSGKLGGNTISEETMDDAEEYIYRAAVAISDKRYDRAIYAVGEASRFIKMETYTGVIEPLDRSAEDSDPIESNDNTGTSTATTAIEAASSTEITQ